MINMNDITIVIPVKNPFNIEDFIERNEYYLLSEKIIVIDSGGGEELRKYATVYVNSDLTMMEARQVGYSLVETKYILNLDSDMVIPNNYISSAIKKLEEDDKLGAISVLHESPTGYLLTHLGFGCSIWKTDILKELYDYQPKQFDSHSIQIGPSLYVVVGFPYCECWYMWWKLASAKYKVGIVPEIPINEHLK